MHFVIMGCGRVGANLATALEASGHTVAVIDQNPDAFRRLPKNFAGETVTGQGFDREPLTAAGIERAYAFAAVSSGDNSNILAARVTRETFGIRNVVARIYDPGRAEVYERLGIATVATVRWAANQVLRRMLPSGAAHEMQDVSGRIVMAEVQVHGAWFGTNLGRIEKLTGARVAYLTRFGEGHLPTSGAESLQEGDLLHVLLEHDSVAEVERTLSLPPELG